MESWPSDLPQNVLSDFSSEMSAGLAVDGETRNPQRTRTYPEFEATFTFFMTLAQLTSFRTWWDTTLNQSVPFTAPWLDACGFDSHFLRFIDAPTWSTKHPGYFTVDLPVEILTNAAKYIG